jgi:hypothetical protein
MSKNEKVLNDILVRMFYDTKKTNGENISLIEQRIPSSIPISDRLSSVNVIPPAMQVRMKDPEGVSKSLAMEYILPEKPEKPVKAMSVATTPGKVTSDEDFQWKLPYYSPRAEILLCQESSCICYGKIKKIPYCKSKTAKSDFEKIYNLDLKEYSTNHKAMVDINDVLTDPHVLLPLASVAATFGIAGVAGIVVGGLLELADVNLYVKEGNELAAGLGTLFLLIPAHQLARFIPGYKNLTSGFIKNLLKKVSKKLPLNRTEAGVVEAINKNKDELVKLTTKIAARSSTLAITSKMNLRQLLLYCLYLIRAGLITSKWTIRIGGVIYTVAALAKKIGVILVGVNDKTQLTVEQKKQPISEIKKSGEDVREEIRDKAIDEIEETDSTQKQMDIVKINIKYTTNQDSINAYHGIY